MELSERLAAACAGPGELVICWLGQAGFYLKDQAGTVFLIDPYFSNCGERIRGFKRLSAQLCRPEELRPDYYCITHTHFDHYDVDAVPVFIAQSDCSFAGPDSCIAALERDGAPRERLRRLNAGATDTFRSLRITAVKADHGDMAPDAIGVLLEMGGHRIYFSGDSAYHADWNAELRGWKPEIACLSINGRFGNMDAVQGAETALELGVRTAIPCHFWTFAEHGGDPGLFCQQLEGSACRALPLRQWEIWVVPPIEQGENENGDHEGSKICGN